MHFMPLTATGVAFLLVGTLLGLILRILGAAIWQQFLTEAPDHDRRPGRSAASLLNTLGTYHYIYGFVLGREYAMAASGIRTLKSTQRSANHDASISCRRERNGFST